MPKPTEIQMRAGTASGDERGSVIVLLAIALVAIVAMAGLAMDGSLLYATKQRTQAAADAAAQAAAMDIYNGMSQATASSSATWYAQQNGFNTASDSVSVTYPSCAGLTWCNGHVSVSGIDSPNLIEVKVSRTVNTTFLRVLSLSASTVSATADAVIALTPAPIPIVVTHPTNANVVVTGGAKSVITICGGGQRAFQVNSSSANAINSPGIDLSHAGPSSNGSCTDAVTGADFAVVGGPATQPNSINLGVDGSYVQPASVIPDPFANVNPPLQPATAPAPTTVTLGNNGCPVATCSLYSPGTYPDAKGNNLDVKNATALFKPGIYYISSGGFSNEANGTMLMATGFTDGPAGTNTGWTGNMLVYNTGTPGKTNTYGTFSFAANSNATLVGSPGNSAYQGILFFQDRNSPALTHSIQGGGSMTLTGTFYITDTLAVMQANPAQYQTLSFGGHGGSSTLIIGDIVTGAISMNGSTSITMKLTSVPTQNAREVALVR